MRQIARWETGRIAYCRPREPSLQFQRTLSTGKEGHGKSDKKRRSEATSRHETQPNPLMVGFWRRGRPVDHRLFCVTQETCRSVYARGNRRAVPADRPGPGRTGRCEAGYDRPCFVPIEERGRPTPAIFGIAVRGSGRGVLTAYPGHRCDDPPTRRNHHTFDAVHDAWRYGRHTQFPRPCPQQRSHPD